MAKSDNQMTVFDDGQPTGKTCPLCSDCICATCLRHRKGDCEYGGCYDDLRALKNPYDQAHGGNVRPGWSEWDKDGEQAHWCRGGMLYPAVYCDKYVRFTGARANYCLGAVCEIFQDGTIRCGYGE